MTEDGDPARLLIGPVDTRLEGDPVFGGQLEPLAHPISLISQTPAAATITKARAAEAISSQRV